MRIRDYKCTPYREHYISQKTLQQTWSSSDKGELIKMLERKLRGTHGAKSFQHVSCHGPAVHFGDSKRARRYSSCCTPRHCGEPESISHGVSGTLLPLKQMNFLEWLFQPWFRRTSYKPPVEKTPLSCEGFMGGLGLRRQASG